MTITSEDSIIAGYQSAIPFYKPSTSNKAASVPHATGLISNGYPAIFTPATPGLAGATIVGTTSTLGGTIPFTNPSSGNTYLAKLAATIGATTAALNFFDLLWYNSGIVVTTTTAQTVSSVALPARDNAGTTNGAGVYCWLYASVATTNASVITNTTISYTNSAGTTGQTATLNMAGGWPATANAGTFLPFSLAAGDLGIQSIQSITLGTSYVAGTINLFLIREIAFVPFVSATSSQILDWANLGFPKLFNGTALSYYVVPSGTGVGAVSGSLTYSQG
jgi:hypothetical protein